MCKGSTVFKTSGVPETVKQHWQHRVDLHQRLRRRCESLPEPVLKQAIKERGGDNGIAEDLTPFGEAAVGGEDHGALLVAGVDELEEQVAAAGNDRQVSDFIHDQQRGATQEANALAQLAFPFGLGERTDDIGQACEVDAAAGLDGLDAEGSGEILRRSVARRLLGGDVDL